MKDFLSYIKKLYFQTFAFLFHILDIIYLILAWFFPGIEVSPIIFGILLYIGIIFGNYQLYRKYQSDSIDLSVSFSNLISSDEADYAVTLKIIDETQINKKVQSEGQSLREIFKKDKEKRKTNFHLDTDWKFPGKYNEDYLDEVKEYESEYRTYLSLKEKIEHRLVKFEPNIINISQSYLTKIRLEFLVQAPIKIPDSERLAFLKAYDFKLTPPIKPDIYESMITQLVSKIAMSPSSDILLSYPKETPPNITGPLYDRDSIIYYKIDSLIPRYLEKDFQPFYLWFDNVSSSQLITLLLKFYCSQLPNPITKNISINVRFE
jgi:hypothetical protein